MGRRYTAADFAYCVALARERIPSLAVTTDVIVGFPGETDDDFAESLAFVRQTSFARLHVFKYSTRQGTLAADMPGQIAPEVKHVRSEAMRMQAQETAAAFAQQFIGEDLRVLWESRANTALGALWKGLTDNYIRAYARSIDNLHNTITPVQLLAPFADGILGAVMV
jgi:threonylcarbamoyladenosine tRNA methylthiotransferase MtaB